MQMAAAKQLEAVRVPLPGSKKMTENKYALTIDHVMTESECKELIELTEKKGYEPALVNVGGGKQVLMTDARDFGSPLLLLRCL
jgi:hypothetical protein